MKCAYKQVQEKEQFSVVTESMIAIYQGISILSIRECFGFGIGRFERYCGEVVSDMDGLISRYQEPGEHGRSEGVYDAYYASRRAVKDIGVDTDEIEGRYKPAQYAPTIGGKEAQKRLMDRLVFLNSMELSVGVLWYTSMLWLHDEYGFGAVRLSRYYNRCREMLGEFAQMYLRFENDKCAKYLYDMRARCEELGVLV